jgi:nicotinate-nucleotide adenylyltransferase
VNKIGILGGTFDPIHHGHLITAQALVQMRKLDKIFFIPCYISPHKTEVSHSDVKHRLNMLKLATAGISYFDYSSMEIDREGISYSIDTIREFKKKYSSIELIIGYDNIEKFYTWKEPDELIKLTQLVVMEREYANEFPGDKYYESAVFVKTPTIDIKATDIRSRVKHSLPIDFLVPEKVKEYIYDNNLYKSSLP